METAENNDRLSRIATLWTAVFRAHGNANDDATSARNRLVMRYSGAAYRYLLGAVRDADTAADLCQDFAVRFLRGDFHRAQPERGRFRDYLKSALVNLVNDHFRNRKAVPLPPDAISPTAPDLPSEVDFIAGWRAELLDQTWKTLHEANPTYHAALLMRIENPDMPSTEMAERLTTQLGKPISSDNVRKTLQRAHEKFATLMIDLVVESLDDPTHAALEAELKTLDLLRFCKTAVERRRT